MRVRKNGSRAKFGQVWYDDFAAYFRWIFRHRFSQNVVLRYFQWIDSFGETQARLAEVSPERLPRRAVRGLGAHSPHQVDFPEFSLCEDCGVGKQSLFEFEDALVDWSGQSVGSAQILVQYTDKSLQFEGQTFVSFEGGGRISGKQTPDLDQKLAGYGDNSGIAIAFAGKEFPAPFSQRGIPAHAYAGNYLLVSGDIRDIVGVQEKKGGVMVSTIRSMPGLHAGDDSLAPLPIESNKNKRRLRKSRSRGLSSRDVFALTPAAGGRDASRLAGQWCNRADQ